RVDDDPETLREPLASLFGDLLHRILARLAIDDDRRGERERPAEERNRQQLFLGDERERRKQEIERQRLPGRRMLGHHDVRAVARRNILSADDAVPDAADNSRGGEIERAPPGDELEARHWRKPEREQYQDGVDRCDDDLEQREQERAQRRHHGAGQSPARSAVTAKAKSGKITVFLGKFPSRSVFSPLPVSTRIG